MAIPVQLALSASTDGAFAQECARYEASDDLPHGFREMASGLFPEFKAECAAAAEESTEVDKGRRQ
ncbi:hypothetical protein [Methylocella sp.]|uniref:hypothetical protein n=1 Tax=Methylocella sp. TaxID=1978226 RepID=UPI003C208B20